MAASDDAYLEWAKAHPSNPKAQAILKAMGGGAPDGGTSQQPPQAPAMQMPEMALSGTPPQPPPTIGPPPKQSTPYDPSAPPDPRLQSAWDNFTQGLGNDVSSMAKNIPGAGLIQRAIGPANTPETSQTPGEQWLYKNMPAPGSQPSKKPGGLFDQIQKYMGHMSGAIGDVGGSSQTGPQLPDPRADADSAPGPSDKLYLKRLAKGSAPVVPELQQLVASYTGRGQ